MPDWMLFKYPSWSYRCLKGRHVWTGLFESRPSLLPRYYPKRLSKEDIFSPFGTGRRTRAASVLMVCPHQIRSHCELCVALLLRSFAPVYGYLIWSFKMFIVNMFEFFKGLSVLEVIVHLFWDGIINKEGTPLHKQALLKKQEFDSFQLLFWDQRQCFWYFM